MACDIVHYFVLFLELAILGRVLYAWVDPTPYPTNRFKEVLWGLTEPILVPLRRYVRPMGMFDFTPVIALLLLQVVQAFSQALLGCPPY